MEEKNIITLDFGTQNIPLPTETKNTSDNTFVQWGLNNQYPAFLLGLYSQSAIHSAIINQKTNYIIGDGLKLADKSDLDIAINPTDNIKEFTSKIVKDYLILNAFAVEVIFNVFGVPVEYHHIPIHKIRTNRIKSILWYCEDWMLTRKSIIYDRFSNKINKDSTSKIFYYDGYFPSVNNTYPTPEYNGTIKSIVTDIAIKEFNLNNIKNHFSVNTIITFYNGGNVTDATKKSIVDEIEYKFKGESGKKFIIDFQNKDGKGAEIKNISANDWDKAYIQVSENNMNDILIGHQVQNPALFAIQIPGKLGSTQELEVSYEIFKSNYIQVKRDEIESALNYLFTNFEGINGKVKFADKPLFNTTLSDTIKEKVYTIDELRAEGGKPPLPNGLGSGLITQSAPSDVPVIPIQEEEVKKKLDSKSLTENDYESIQHLGLSEDDFDIVEEVKHHHFDIESDIAKFVIDNDIKGLKINELVDLLIKEGIETNQSDLNKILNRLNKSGVIGIDTDSEGRIKITPSNLPKVPDTDKIETLYKYIKRPEVSGADLLPTSRSFCVKLIGNRRLYSREEISTMDSIFGFELMKYGGGFWYNKDTGETTSHCRHQFIQVKVKRKVV